MKDETRKRKINDNLLEVFSHRDMFVIYREGIDEKPIADLYIKNKDIGAHFIGSVSPQLKRLKPVGYYFNGKLYEKIDVLLADIEKYNKKLPFPIWTDDPLYNKLAKHQRKVGWYLQNVLGFEYDYNGFQSDVYEKKGPDDESLSRIHIIYNEKWDTIAENISGKVIRYFHDGFAWKESSFEGIDECIASINGMIEPNFLVGIVDRIDTINGMTNARNYEGKITKETGEVENLKVATKKLLEDALTRLNANM